jgi:hypothetical protein
MPADERYRYELEHLWKMRADNVKARLDQAAESVEELSESPETDSDAFNDAVRVYTETLEEFTNISKIYQDLVLHGTIPGKDNGSGHERWMLDGGTMSRPEGRSTRATTVLVDVKTQ